MEKSVDFESFRKVVANVLEVPDEDITYDLDVYQELGIDSLGLVSLCNNIMEYYQVDVPPADIVELHTIGQLYETLAKVISNNRGIESV